MHLSGDAGFVVWEVAAQSSRTTVQLRVREERERVKWSKCQRTLIRVI